MTSAILQRLSHLSPRRRLLLGAALAALLAAVLWSSWQLMPRHYTLRITGGAITGNRHFLAKGLQHEAADNGVTLNVRPTEGSDEALALVDAGKLDLAFVQGGLDLPYEDVVHVASVSAELLHVLVRPDITSLAALRGQRINLGSKKGGTRVIARQLLHFAGLREDVDYVESNLSTEELLTLSTERLPAALVIISLPPSEIVNDLVRRHGYTLLEVDYPAAFAQRYEWASEGRVLAYTYQVAPAVPPRDLKTIGVNLRLVANRQADPRAVVKVLESLFSAGLQARVKLHLDEADILASASYPPSEGTRRFMDRNRPLFSSAILDKLKAALGLIVSLVSTGLVIFKWFKSAPAEKPAAVTDSACLAYLDELAALETRYGQRLAKGVLAAPELDELDASLSALKTAAIGDVGKANPHDRQLLHSLFVALADSRARLDSARGQRPMPPS